MLGEKASGAVDVFKRLMGRGPDAVETAVIQNIHKSGGNVAVARVLLNSSAFISY
jgi:hypothetical protein